MEGHEVLAFALVAGKQLGSMSKLMTGWLAAGPACA